MRLISDVERILPSWRRAATEAFSDATEAMPRLQRDSERNGAHAHGAIAARLIIEELSALGYEVQIGGFDDDDDT